MNLVTNRREIKTGGELLTSGHTASELHDLLRSYHRANGKSVHISVITSCRQRAEKVVWENHVPAFSIR